MDSSTLMPEAVRVPMACFRAAKPPSGTLLRLKPQVLRLLEPGMYTSVGEKKPRKMRVNGSVAAWLDSALSLLNPSAPFSRA
jgi:hypothetical protein